MRAVGLFQKGWLILDIPGFLLLLKHACSGNPCPFTQAGSATWKHLCILLPSLLLNIDSSSGSSFLTSQFLGHETFAPKMRAALVNWIIGPLGQGSPDTSLGSTEWTAHPLSVSSLHRGGSSRRPAPAWVYHAPQSTWQMLVNTCMESRPLNPLGKGAGVYQIDREGMRLWIWGAAGAKAQGQQDGWSKGAKLSSTVPRKWGGWDTCPEELQGRGKGTEKGGPWRCWVREPGLVSAHWHQNPGSLQAGVKSELLGYRSDGTASGGERWEGPSANGVQGVEEMMHLDLTWKKGFPGGANGTCRR